MEPLNIPINSLQSSAPIGTGSKSWPAIQGGLFAEVILCPTKRKNGISPQDREKLLSAIREKNFNTEQRAALEHREGPMVILAGAGSGKTHVIAHRAAYLVGIGVVPGRILAVTFTKKAAQEMQQRCKAILRPFTQGKPYVRTLHSVGLKILTEFGATIGYHGGVKILPEIFASEYLTEALKAVDRAGLKLLRGEKAEALRVQISLWKNQGKSPGEVRDLMRHPLGEAFCAYQTWLQQNGYVDFDDLIRLPSVIFEKTAEALRSFQSKFDFIMVDEYQDTNPAQCRLLKHLAARHGNILVVGDPYQAIYGWRGADVKQMAEFSTHYPHTKRILLETNYRSAGAILDLANKLMESAPENEPERKVLRPHKPGGGSPVFNIFHDSEHEAKSIAEQIKREIEVGNRKPGDFAILLRDQYRADPIEEALAAFGIPYQLFFSDNFKMGPLKRSAYSILAAIDNPKKSEPAFLQLLRPAELEDGISGRIPFVLSRNDFEQMLRLRNFGKIPIWEVIKNPQNRSTFSSDGQEQLSAFVKLIEQLHKQCQLKARFRGASLAAIALVAYQARFPGATDSACWANPETRNEETRALRTIIKNIERFENSVRPHQRNFNSYLQFQLVEIPRRIKEGRAKKKSDGVRPAVSLMTIHAAKGLEFPVVFMPAMANGVIPSKRTAEDERPDALEEERRLAFVGITRAKEELFLSYPKCFKRRGQEIPQMASPFLGEMGLID